MKRKHEVWVWVAGIGGGGLLLLVLVNKPHISQSPSHAVATGHTGNTPRTMPNPGQASLDAMVLNARQAALGIYDQSAVAEQSNQAQLDASINNNYTNKLVAFNTNATQLKMTGVETAAAQAIASAQYAAQEQIAQTEMQPYNTMANTYQNNSWWQSILGIAASFFNPFISLFGGGGSSGVTPPFGVNNPPPGVPI